MLSLSDIFVNYTGWLYDYVVLSTVRWSYNVSNSEIFVHCHIDTNNFDYRESPVPIKYYKNDVYMNTYCEGIELMPDHPTNVTLNITDSASKLTIKINADDEYAYEYFENIVLNNTSSKILQESLPSFGIYDYCICVDTITSDVCYAILTGDEPNISNYYKRLSGSNTLSPMICTWNDFPALRIDYAFSTGNIQTARYYFSVMDWMGGFVANVYFFNSKLYMPIKGHNLVLLFQRQMNGHEASEQGVKYVEYETSIEALLHHMYEYIAKPELHKFHIHGDINYYLMLIIPKDSKYSRAIYQIIDDANCDYDTYNEAATTTFSYEVSQSTQTYICMSPPSCGYMSLVFDTEVTISDDKVYNYYFIFDEYDDSPFKDNLIGIVKSGNFG